MAPNAGLTIGAAIAAPVLALGGVVGFLLVGAGTAEASCNSTGVAVVDDAGNVPAGTVAGYSGEQLVNARHILGAGAALGLGVRDQTIGVMTAMGESSLRVVDHGDTAGPDSRGLFQQRDNGAWGSYADRMDPLISATSFFTAMGKISDRDSLAPTIVAHRTQRNADPYHYERFWDAAVTVVEAVAGSPTGLAPGTGDQVCTATPGAPVRVNPAGWVAPSAGPVTSDYGMRFHPIHKEWRLHAGTDLNGGGCNGPIWAVNDGVVTFAGAMSGYGYMIEVDHAGGLRTRYAHMHADGVLVDVGDVVTGGQNIARVGNTGSSTACHLHFEVYTQGEPTDPARFFAGVGITL